MRIFLAFGIAVIVGALLCGSGYTIGFSSVAAQEFITIQADGSVYPLGAPIHTTDNVTYSLSGDITIPIIVQRNDILFRGGTYMLAGTGGGSGQAITLQNVQNVTVTSMNIRTFTTGIRVISSSNCTLLANEITGNDVTGVDISYSNGTTVAGNSVTSNGLYGLALTYAFGSNISANYISANSGMGLLIQESPYTTLRNNVMENDFNLEVIGSDLSDFVNDIDVSNTVNGKGVYYFVNQEGLQVNPSSCPNIGYIGIANSTNVTIRSIQITDNGQGLLLAHTNNSLVEECSFANNQYGVTMFSSWNNSISDNSITQNSQFGVEVDSLSAANSISSNNISHSLRGINLEPHTFGNLISRNNINHNFEKGIELFGVSNNTISDNTITYNGNGIVVSDSSYNEITGNNITQNQVFGIVMQLYDYGCFNNTISFNIFNAHSRQGIHIEDSNNTIVLSNNITNNLLSGIYLRRSWGGLIYENNFVNNTVNVNTAGCANAWDNGTTGNFWDNYNGTGIQPYVIDASNQDNHPLVQIVQIPETSLPTALAILLTVTLILSIIGCRSSMKFHFMKHKRVEN